MNKKAIFSIVLTTLVLIGSFGVYTIVDGETKDNSGRPNVQVEEGSNINRGNEVNKKNEITEAEIAADLVERGNSMSTVYDIFKMFNYDIQVISSNVLQVNCDDKSSLELRFDSLGELQQMFVE